MNLINNIKKFFFDKKARFRFFARIGIYNNLSDEEFLKKAFKVNMGYKLDLKSPKTFNEKLQWLKLYNRKPEYTMMVDKYKVREYISKVIGKEYLIPLLGVWDNPDEIDFEKLPNQFVLKCNHNSGTGMYICKDKSKIDIEKVKNDLQRGLEEDYYMEFSREWPYKNVPRKIICEKFMQNDDASDELSDYKILCFNGEPKLIEVHKNRFTPNHTQDFYDINWNLTSISQCGDFAGKTNKEIEKPKTLEKMLEFSKILSKNIMHVRCDWYEVNGKLFFGELTFFDGAGLDAFDDFKHDELLGSWIKLPIDNE